jgi:hypothetical protein
MIRATSSFDGPLMTLNASVSGPVVHLDNWAIGELAEGDALRRSRFVDAIHSGGMDLLFSVTNAAEISGPQVSGFGESVLGRDWVALVSREVRPN